MEHMPELITIAKFGLYAVMILSTAAALGVVMLPNIFYAALALVVVLVGTACIFLAMHAEFLAVVQILLYVGAVMTLVIFAIMLTNRLSDPVKEPTETNKLTATFIVGTVTLLLFQILLLVFNIRVPLFIHLIVLSIIVLSAPSGLRQTLLSLCACIVFIVILHEVIAKTPWPVQEATLRSTVSTVDLGIALMGTYVFPFEVISIVLIAALIGAIVIARKDREV